MKNNNSKDSLGDRMKKAEDTFRFKVPPRSPLIIRIDGKAFHSLTKRCKRPSDTDVVDCMEATAKELCSKISSVKLAYVQSDEISLLVTPYEDFNTQAWFDGNIQKIVSISASIASTTFTKKSLEIKDSIDKKDILYCNAYEKFGNTPALFDSRIFTLPENDIVNYFLWRQQDATRNSVQMLARSLFSHKECNNKNCTELKNMCIVQKNINWESTPTSFKRGFCIIKKKNEIGRSKWTTDKEIPIFSEDRDYIKNLIPVT